MNPSFSISINTGEILALISIFQITSWIGFDSLKPYSPQETEELVRQGIYRLNGRGLLSKDQNKNYYIHAGFNKILTSVLEPAQVFTTYCESQKAASWVFLHSSLHVIENRTDEGLEFITVKDIEGIREYLSSLWDLNRFEPEGFTPQGFIVDIQQVQDAQSGNPNGIEAYFLKEKIPQAAWSMLKQLFGGSIRADSITQQNPFLPEIVVESFRWISLENYAWQITIEDDNGLPVKLRFERLTFAMIKDKISRLLKP